MARAQFVVYFLLHENPLHADARLARVAERARGDHRHRGGEVGVVVDDHACVAAKFEAHAFFSRERLQPPADIGAAGEAHHGHAIVRHEVRGILIRADDEVHLPRGHTRRTERFREE